MAGMSANFIDPDRVRQYVEKGPPAFAPGHSSVLQMVGVLLSETMGHTGTVLIVGVGGGLETRYLAGIEPKWRFVGVDPAPAMLDLARETAGEVAGDRLTLLEGTVTDAPVGPFDAATCILVLGLIPDDGSKLALLREARGRLRPGAPFVLVDQCFDKAAPDYRKRLDRYGAYAARSGISADMVANAKAALDASETVATAARDEALLVEAGFGGIDLFYIGMAWRGWVAYA